MILQSLIFIFSCSAIYLTGSLKYETRMYGAILGLCGQPLWLYTTITSEQYGITALCLFYTYSWARAAYNNYKHLAQAKKEIEKFRARMNEYTWPEFEKMDKHTNEK